MITDEALIIFLADGEFHSGEEIGVQLGVSRTAIWKRLKKLSSLGLKVDSVKGCGYRLSQKIELLDKNIIDSYLSAKAKLAINDLYIASITESTNNYLLERWQDNHSLSASNVCLAEYQSGGRGRRGRQWISPYGANLYLSLDWQFEGGIAALEGLSLAVGVAVSRSLSALGVAGVSLKWPNDILIDGAKLGGILIDVRGDHSGPCRAVIGVGVNVNMSDQVVDIDQPWVDLKSIYNDFSRNKLAANMLDELINLLASYESTGFQSYVSEWQSLDAFRDKLVDVISGEQKVSGICCGIADDGALIIDIDGVKKFMHGGELSLRLSNES